MTKFNPACVRAVLTGLIVTGVTPAFITTARADEVPTAVDTVSAATPTVARAGIVDAGMVTNGNFEDGAAGWSAQLGSMRIADRGLAGSRAAVLTRARTGAVVLTDSPDVRGDIQRGDVYRGMLYLRSTGHRLGSTVVVREVRPSGRVVNRVVRTLGLGRSWVQVPLRSTAQVDGSHFDLRVKGTGVNRKNALVVDAVSLQRTFRKVVNQAPVATFTNVNDGTTVAFDGSGSTDPDGSISSYTWSFGDGTTGTGVKPSKVYAAAGTYTAKLTVKDNRNAAGTATRTVTVTVPVTPVPNQAPTASFTSSATDLTASFDGTGSTDPDGTVASYAWTFGDGSTGTGATASHAYAATGTYSVKLTVTDDKGATSTVTKSVTVTAPNQAPTAAFTSSATDLTASFNGTGSTDPDGTVASYAWTFGDGSTGTGATATRTYAAAGTYSVKLTVTDDKGATSSVTKSVTVTAPVVPNQAPTAAFTSSTSDLTASFNGTGSTDPDGTVASYAWTFGDGSTGTGATATRTYAAAGTYSVKLTVTDNDGATSSVTKSVTVTAPVVPNQAPTAAFTSSTSDLTATFNGTGSSDSDGTVASYAWTFGDGSTGTGATATRTYAAAGTYSVKLTVTDNDGATSTVTKSVTVTAPVPPAPAPAIGSAPVGTTSYPVPANAIYVVAQNGTGGLGTQASPYQSVATAISKAASGSTLVLRGGTYRESVKIPIGKALTIQNYPGEAVWFDGADKVTGWTQSGSTWVVNNWTYLFDHRVSFGAGMDESSRYVDPAYPMAGYADAVWIDGVELTQVGSEAAVTTGKFYVDETNKRLVIGSDPTGKTVEASKLAKAIQNQGAGSTLRGFGVKRYAAHLALYGAISNEVNDCTYENLVIQDNATLGIGGWGDRATYRNLTVTGNGLLGIAADQAPGLLITKSVVKGNNDQKFKQEPVSGGIKTSNTDGAEFSDNLIEGNNTIGLWLDVSMRNFKIMRNKITGNSEGLEVELSGHGIIADNYIVRNNKAGLFLFDTNDVKVWNNTFEANSRSLQFLQDERRNTNTATKDYVPWVMSNIELRNNVVTYGANSCPILTQDLTNTWYGNQFGISSEGNVFYRASATSPSKFACWANGSAGTTSFTNLAGWQSNTSNDMASKYYEGTSIVTSTGALTSTVQSGTTSVPRSLPADVASAIGKPAGDKSLGAFMVR